MKKSVVFTAALMLGASLPALAQFNVERKWSFNHGMATTGRSSEIVTFDPLTGALWVVGGNGLDVLNLDGTRRVELNTQAWGTVNSIAIRGDVAAVSFTNTASPSGDGTVQFFRTNDFVSNATPTPIRSVTVGAVPDMVTWTPDGRLLVANEGERVSSTVNPAGSVSILSFGASGPSASGIAANAPSVATAGFAGVPLVGNVRLEPGVSAANGLEPEYIAVNPGSTKALVTLQEANAFGVLDLVTNGFQKIVSLGAKDFNLPGNQIDTTSDGLRQLRSVPVKGLYMPDTVVSYVGKDGKTYFVTANEGDAFVDNSDLTTVGAVTLAAGLQSQVSSLPVSLSALQISRLDGKNAQGDYESLFAFGARSFAIWDEDGNLVKDSGDAIERKLIELLPMLYADNRSPAKGVEPEGIAVRKVGDRIYAFIGLERTSRSVVAVFDITDPTDLKFLQFITGNQGESRPEGLYLFDVQGLLYLAVAQEDPSNITTLYQLTEIPEPSTYALMLAGLAALGFAARRRRGAATLPA